VKRTLALLVATLALGACMEMEQESAKKEVGKTVKSDTLPWNNEPVAGGPKWTKGDRNSWEDQIKKRQLAQHEHKRIYQ
jgi:PBP1b-binding outer membrane lipoprotein LpoB